IPCCREAYGSAIRELKIKNEKLKITRSDDELFELFFAISGRLFSEAKRGLHTVAEVMELYPAEFIAKSGLADDPMNGVGAEELTETFKHAFRAAWGTTHTLVPGAEDTLRALQHKGYRLFAASNSFGHLQRSRLQHAGILHYFEDTYISMDIGYDKPDVRFYEEALRRCGLQAHEVVMVGDSMTTDIIGAQQAGLDAIYFNRRNEAVSYQPSISSLAELEACIEAEEQRRNSRCHQ
ncbi:MAG: HAD-IA family hydrolase, partial [Paludibacteraceae bacterium]|nr:HAD-IA family hydrolase [Paludibacteraceae bacterium]